MEKCGCDTCVLVGSIKATDREDYDIENCPCKNCLVKAICNRVCKGILDYCRNYK